MGRFNEMRLKVEDFEMVKCIGRGAFGEVQLVSGFYTRQKFFCLRTYKILKIQRERFHLYVSRHSIKIVIPLLVIIENFIILVIL